MLFPTGKSNAILPVGGVVIICAMLALLAGTACSPSKRDAERLQKTLELEKKKAEQLKAQAEAEEAAQAARKEAEAKALEEASKVSAASGAIGVGEPLDPFLTTDALTDDVELREAIAALARARPNKAMLTMLSNKKAEAGRALAKALWHTQTNVRTQSGSLLAHVKASGEHVDKALTRSLRTEPDRDVRAMVAKSLVALEPKSMVPLLLEVLAKDGEGQVRANAAYALGAIGDKVAVDQLIIALGDSETWVRMRAVTALRRLKARKAVRALERMLSDKNVLVRQDTVRALKAITGKRYKERKPRLIQ